MTARNKQTPRRTKHFLGNVFAHQEVAETVGGRTVAAGELHEHIPTFGAGEELGVLAPRRRAWLAGE